MVLRQLAIDLTQHCTFTKGSGHEFCLWSKLIGGIMSSPNLQKRTALFKDLCSKLLASWRYDSAQCIACTRRTFATCAKACGKIRSESLNGTCRALASPCICPLCSACSKQGLTTTVKQLQSRNVCQIGSTSFCCELRQTNLSSHPKVLLSPFTGSCSMTASSNSCSRSNYLISIVGWASSPANVVKTKCMVSALSSLHCEVDTEIWSAIMAVFPLYDFALFFSSPKGSRLLTFCLCFNL